MSDFFRMSWSEPYEGPIETLRLNHDPRQRLNGIFAIVTDANGERWHLNGQRGEYVMAARVSAIPDYWTSTANEWSGGVARWLPCRVEVVTCPPDQAAGGST